MLMQHHLVLEPELREKLVGALVLMKKKDILSSETYDTLLLSIHLPMLISTPDYSTLSSQFLSLHLARPCGLCCSRRSFLNSVLQTLRLPTTS
jgi:hypothetical protein